MSIQPVQNSQSFPDPVGNPMIAKGLLRAVPTNVPPVMMGRHKAAISTMPTGRTKYRWNAPNLLYNRLNRTVRFYLPQQGIFDLTTCILQMEMQPTSTVGGDAPVFQNGSWTAIYALRFVQNGRIVKETVDYGWKYTQDYEHHQNPLETANHMVEYGIGNLVARQTWATVPRQYWIPLDFFFFETVWDMQQLKGQCWFEIELYNPIETLETAAPAAGQLDIQVTNPVLIVDALENLPPNYLGQSRLDGQNWTRLECDILFSDLTGVNAATHEIPTTASSLQRIEILQLPPTVKTDTTWPDRFCIGYYSLDAAATHLSTLRWDINGKLFPHDPVNCTSVAGPLGDGQNDLWLYYLTSKNATHSSLFTAEKEGEERFSGQLNISRANFYDATLPTDKSPTPRHNIVISFEQNHAPGDLNPVSAGPGGKIFAQLTYPIAVNHRNYYFIYSHINYKMEGGQLVCYK